MFTSLKVITPCNAISFSTWNTLKKEISFKDFTCKRTMRCHHGKITSLFHALSFVSWRNCFDCETQMTRWKLRTFERLQVTEASWETCTWQSLHCSLLAFHFHLAAPGSFQVSVATSDFVVQLTRSQCTAVCLGKRCLRAIKLSKNALIKKKRMNTMKG